jgi:hypothetical protein
MQLVNLTVYKKNGNLTSQTIAVDVDDLAIPIRFNSNSKSYFSLVSRSPLNQITGISDDYEVNETLAEIKSLSSKLVSLTVLSRNNFDVTTETMVFNCARISGPFVTVGVGTEFLYCEIGSPEAVKYVVSNSIADIMTQQESGGGGGEETEATVNVTSDTIDLASVGDATIINLVFSDPNQEVKSIINYDSNRKITLRPDVAASPTFVDESNTLGGNLKLAAPTLQLIGERFGFLTLEKRNNDYFFEVNFIDQYMELANPQPLGQRFSYDFEDGDLLTDFDNTSGNFSADGTQITATKSGGTLFSSVLYYNVDSYQSNLETWKEVVTYNVGLKDGLGLGVGTGLGNSKCALLLLTAAPGKIRIYDSSSETQLAESAGTLTINNNDDIEFTVEDVNGTITATALNLTTPGSVSVSYTYSLSYPIPAGGSKPVNFSPALFAIGGTQYVYDWVYSSNAVVNAKWGVISDSTAGYFAGTANQRWGEIMAAGEPLVIYNAPGATTLTMSYCIDEILALSPQNVFFDLWANGLINSVGHGTIIAEAKAMIQALQTNGSNVVLLDCAPIENPPRDAAAFNVDLLADPDLGPLVLVGAYELARNGGTANTWDATRSPEPLGFRIHGNATWHGLIGAEARTQV